MSDCHRGDGSKADDFFRNENLYFSALNHYYNSGYTYIEIGDGDELWENKKLSDIINEHLNVFHLLGEFHHEGRLYFIYGNHDLVKKNEKFVRSNLAEYYDIRERKTLPLFENVRVHEVSCGVSGRKPAAGEKRGPAAGKKRGPAAGIREILLIHAIRSTPSTARSGSWADFWCGFSGSHWSCSGSAIRPAR
jgi:hypothetical protein